MLETKAQWSSLKELGFIEPRAGLCKLMVLEVGEVGLNCGLWGWTGLCIGELELNCVD